MTDRETKQCEKVINALGRCGLYGYCDDKQCPYYKNTRCLESLREDALDLLKAQEARVMTLTEVMVYDNRNGCIWYEDETKNIVPAFVFSEGYRRTSGIVGVMSPCFTFIAKPQYHRFERMEGYGKTWRCWTSRPTEEQRQATPWPEPPKEEKI